jgi:tetratricopeptide (TPR) repeat protein
MQEVLAEQISSGNAAGAVNGLQAMLRTNPHDKRAWELILEAYRKLKQPQKVKIAYQHYLKFFPDEVTAKMGLISFHAGEKDLKGALALLDLYETELLRSGKVFDDLEAVYKALEETDPINERVLDGLSRVYLAAGKTREHADLAPKIAALKNISGKSVEDTLPLPEQTVFESDSFGQQTDGQSAFSGEAPEVSDSVFDLNRFEEQEDSPFAAAFSAEAPDLAVTEESTAAALPVNADEEIEIEVEFDDFEVADEAIAASDTLDLQEDNWLDSVGEILESISTSTRGVKFAGGMDGNDAQSHYDLGMAFKEMGLYDDAINEFRQASANPDRRVECLIFQGACLRDKGDVTNAEIVLRSLLKPSLNQEDFLSAKYELSLTCNAAHKPDEYARLLAEIEAASPGYRDVRSLIAKIGTKKNDLDFSEDDLKGFDF